ncbi:LptF/LptG family permease [Oricola nitratireducens]|uniref:LptF/LptG family permease n=1 Tax=Oricola nitratireducens TaxID=2775868 RepID=UPI001869180D|nr:LptF/LptG family permease [Oricola nitratireducens]
MNTLQRYIFRRISVITLASFFAVLAVVWVSQVLTRIDVATASGQSMFTFLKLAAVLTPQLAALVLPIAVVIGTVQVFTTMNADSELAVMSASGVSRQMIARPVLLVAILASLFVFVSNHFIEPRANRSLRDLLVSSRTDLLTSLIQEGVFTKIDDDLTIYVDRRLPGNALSGIMVSDTRDEHLALLYYAQSGAVGKVDGNDVMVMTNGQIQRKNLDDNSLSIIRFNSYAISLSQFASATDALYYFPQERETADLIDPDPNDWLFQSKPGWLYGEFHRRMTDWLYPILFAYVALVVAGQTRSHRQTRFNAFVLTIGATLVYRWAAYAVFNVNRLDGDLWWLFYAVPVVAIVISALMYRYGITIAVPDRVAAAYERFADHVRQLRIRAARARTV